MPDTLTAFEQNEASTPIAGTRYRVNAALADRVNRLIAEAPDDIRPDLQRAITSGYRDYQQQVSAYMHHLAGGGMAAKPGHSWHERLNGMAVDWNHVTPRAWAYLKPNAIRYGLGFPLGAGDPYHMQPIETYAGGINSLASAATGHRVSATPVPFAFDDVHSTDSGPPLKLAPINPVPAATDSALGQTIITKPTPMAAPAPFHPIQGPRGAMPSPNLANGFRSALATILRQR